MTTEGKTLALLDAIEHPAMPDVPRTGSAFPAIAAGARLQGGQIDLPMENLTLAQFDRRAGAEHCHCAGAPPSAPVKWVKNWPNLMICNGWGHHAILCVKDDLPPSKIVLEAEVDATR